MTYLFLTYVVIDSGLADLSESEMTKSIVTLSDLSSKVALLLFYATKISFAVSLY
jgi:hypothetical protein